eukprot:2369053-Rhodomonas_salina.1
MQGTVLRERMVALRHTLPYAYAGCGTDLAYRSRGLQYTHSSLSYTHTEPAAPPGSAAGSAA